MAHSINAATAVWLDRSTQPHISTLVLVSGIGALNMTIILPSLPSLAAHFGVEYGVIQLAVSAYLGATALLQLIIGPLSDRYGRRPVMITTMAVFVVATLGCILAPTAELFLASRMVQAAVVSGFALSRAIVRDTVGAAASASMIGYITTGMALMPMLGPIVGGLLQEGFGWQAAFVFNLLVGGVILLLVMGDLGETNQTKSASFTAQFRTYPELVASRRFWGYALTATFASGAFFAVLGGMPIVGTEVLGLSPREFAIAFAIIPCGYMCGNFVSGRLSERVGLSRMMLAGSLTALFGVAIALGFALAGIQSVATVFGPIFFMGFGNGLSMPSSNAGVVSVRPHLAGSASGLGGALMVGGGAVLSATTGALLGPETGSTPLFLMMLASTFGSLLATLSVIWIDWREGPLAA